MAADVTLRLEAQAGNTSQVITALEKKVEKLGNKLEAVSRKGRKGAQQMKGGFDRVKMSAAGVAIAVTGISSGIGLATKGMQLFIREWDSMLERQRKAKNTQLSFEQSLVQATRNAIGIFSAKEVKSLALKLAEETGVSPTKAAGVIGSAVTSTGVTNKKEAELAIKASKAALKFAPELDPQGVEALAGVAASISKRFKITAEAAIGFIQRVGGQANVRELEPLIKNVAPVVSNLTQFGFTPAEAGALVSTLTQGTGDVTGELSGTAAINVADSLAKQVKARPERFGGLKVNEAGAIVDAVGKAAAGRALDILANDPELKEVFFSGGRLDGISTPKANLGKGKAKPTIRGILTKGTVAQQQFEGSKRVIGGFKEGQKTFDDFIKDVKTVTTVSQVDRNLKSFSESLRIADQAGGRTAAVREGLLDALEARGSGSFARTKAGARFDFKTTQQGKKPIDAAIEILERKQKQSQAAAKNQKEQSESFFGGPFGRGAATAGAAKAQSEANSFGKIIEEFRELKELTREQNQLLKNNKPPIRRNAHL